MSTIATLDAVPDAVIDRIMSLYRKNLRIEPGTPSHIVLSYIWRERLGQAITAFIDRHDCGPMESWDDHWQTLFRIEHPGVLP